MSEEKYVKFKEFTMSEFQKQPRGDYIFLTKPENSDKNYLRLGRRTLESISSEICEVFDGNAEYLSLSEFMEITGEFIIGYTTTFRDDLAAYSGDDLIDKLCKEQNKLVTNDLKLPPGKTEPQPQTFLINPHKYPLTNEQLLELQKTIIEQVGKLKNEMIMEGSLPLRPNYELLLIQINNLLAQRLENGMHVEAPGIGKTK